MQPLTLQGRNSIQPKLILCNFISTLSSCHRFYSNCRSAFFLDKSSWITRGFPSGYSGAQTRGIWKRQCTLESSSTWKEQRPAPPRFTGVHGGNGVSRWSKPHCSASASSRLPWLEDRLVFSEILSVKFNLREHILPSAKMFVTWSLG